MATADAKALGHENNECLITWGNLGSSGTGRRKEIGDRYLRPAEGPLSGKGFQVPQSFLTLPPGGRLGAPRVAPQGPCTGAQLPGPTPVFSGPEPQCQGKQKHLFDPAGMGFRPHPTLFSPSPHQSTLRSPSSLFIVVVFLGTPDKYQAWQV